MRIWITALVVGATLAAGAAQAQSNAERANDFSRQLANVGRGDQARRQADGARQAQQQAQQQATVRAQQEQYNRALLAQQQAHNQALLAQQRAAQQHH